MDAAAPALLRHPCGLLDGLIWPEGEGLKPLASPQRSQASYFPPARKESAPLHRETK